MVQEVKSLTCSPSSGKQLSLNFADVRATDLTTMPCSFLEVRGVSSSLSFLSSLEEGPCFSLGTEMNAEFP